MTLPPYSGRLNSMTRRLAFLLCAAIVASVFLVLITTSHASRDVNRAGDNSLLEALLFVETAPQAQQARSGRLTTPDPVKDDKQAREGQSKVPTGDSLPEVTSSMPAGKPSGQIQVLVELQDEPATRVYAKTLASSPL